MAMTNEEKSEFLEKAMEKAMGQALDMGRLAIQNERSWEQFFRSTKINFNQLRRILKQELLGIVEEAKKT